MAMTITPAAAEMISDRLRRSEISNPVVCLVQMSNSPPEIQEAINRGATGKELEAISRAALANVPRYLYPAVYPRSQFLWIFTTTIAGFPFAARFVHPPYARAAMKRGVLDVAERGLVLKDLDGTVVLPKQGTNAL